MQCKNTLEEKKKEALEKYKETRKKYLDQGTNETWKEFCEAKRLCRLLGVII